MDGAQIRQITVFSDLDESQCECVAGACADLEVEAGTTLTEEGDFGYAMFAVTSGTADVYKDGSLIRTLGPGDVFGEIAVFFGGRRTATVVATSPMQPRHALQPRALAIGPGGARSRGHSSTVGRGPARVD